MISAWIIALYVNGFCLQAPLCTLLVFIYRDVHLIALAASKS